MLQYDTMSFGTELPTFQRNQFPQALSFFFSTQKQVTAQSSKMWVNSYLTKQNHMQKTTIFKTTFTQQHFMLAHTHTHTHIKCHFKSEKFHAWNMWQH